MFLDTAIEGAGLAALVMLTSAVIASRAKPSAAVHSAMQHLAAGVICAVVAAELIPEAMETHRPIELSLGFFAGLVLMLSAKAVSDRLGGERRRTGMLIAVGVDVAIDGLLIGVGFAIGTGTGSLFALAFALEFTAVGLVVGAAKGQSTARAAGTAALIAAPVIPAAAAGEWLLSPLSPPLAAALMGFAASVCLYLVIEELMREAHAVKEHPVANWLFFAGFLALVLLEMHITS